MGDAMNTHNATTGLRSRSRLGRSALELARDSVDNQLRNGRACPNDTDGDGDCGRVLCPVCGQRSDVKNPIGLRLKALSRYSVRVVNDGDGHHDQMEERDVKGEYVMWDDVSSLIQDLNSEFSSGEG